MKSANLMLLAVLSLGVAGAVAEEKATEKTDEVPAEVWTQKDVEIREGKGAIFPVVAGVKKGTRLVVLGKEGKWLKVKVDEKEGYVFEGAISAKKVGRDLMAGLEGSDAGSLDTAGAGKGLDQSSVDYADARGFSSDGLNQLVEIRKSITPKMWMDFVVDGGVGPEAGQGASKNLGKMTDTLLQPNPPTTKPTTKPTAK